MDVEILERQLKIACDEESEDTVENVIKVRKIIQRRLKNLSTADYNDDEIIFGGAMAIAALLQKISPNERKHYNEVIKRIVNG